MSFWIKGLVLLIGGDIRNRVKRRIVRIWGLLDIRGEVNRGFWFG